VIHSKNIENKREFYIHIKNLEALWKSCPAFVSLPKIFLLQYKKIILEKELLALALSLSR